MSYLALPYSDRPTGRARRAFEPNRREYEQEFVGPVGHELLEVEVFLIPYPVLGDQLLMDREDQVAIRVRRDLDASPGLISASVIAWLSSRAIDDREPHLHENFWRSPDGDRTFSNAECISLTSRVIVIDIVQRLTAAFAGPRR